MQGVEVADGVEYESLAQRAVGYSGDDLTGVCRDAALNGMRRKVAGLAPDQIKCASCCCCCCCCSTPPVMHDAIVCAVNGLRAAVDHAFCRTACGGC